MFNTTSKMLTCQILEDIENDDDILDEDLADLLTPDEGQGGTGPGLAVQIERAVQEGVQGQYQGGAGPGLAVQIERAVQEGVQGQYQGGAGPGLAVQIEGCTGGSAGSVIPSWSVC